MCFPRFPPQAHSPAEMKGDKKWSRLNPCAITGYNAGTQTISKYFTDNTTWVGWLPWVSGTSNRWDRSDLDGLSQTSKRFVRCASAVASDEAYAINCSVRCHCVTPVSRGVTFRLPGTVVYTWPAKFRLTWQYSCNRFAYGSDVAIGPQPSNRSLY